MVKCPWLLYLSLSIITGCDVKTTYSDNTTEYAIENVMI